MNQFDGVFILICMIFWYNKLRGKVNFDGVY